MVALTQAHADEYTRLRKLQYTLFARLKPLPLPRIAEEKPKTLRPDDALARLGEIPGAGGKYPAKRRRKHDGAAGGCYSTPLLSGLAQW